MFGGPRRPSCFYFFCVFFGSEKDRVLDGWWVLFLVWLLALAPALALALVRPQPRLAQLRAFDFERREATEGLPLDADYSTSNLKAGPSWMLGPVKPRG